MIKYRRQSQMKQCFQSHKVIYTLQVIKKWILLVNHNKIIAMKSSDNLQDQRKRIGQYSYSAKDVIGKGYSSVVYRGQSQAIEQPIAIKLIDMKNVKGQIHKTLLNNQTEILRLLNNLHNVIKLYDILALKSHTCIVTQLCDGGDLGKLIKARKYLPEREAVNILTQVINGYREINRFGVVHRDLKPANIFFNEGKVKIADFGFAIRNADLKKSSNYNVGSPVYMPLEALNDNIYSSKSDIWAIGVIFYEMLTGRTPWKAKTESDLKRQIRAVPIKTLLPTNISRMSADFLTRTLQINPSLRMSPQQMHDFFQKGKQEDYQQSTGASIMRTNYLFRTRAVSQDREDRNQINPIPKNTVTAPKTYRKISRIVDQVIGLQKINEGANGIERGIQGSRRLDKLGETKLGNLARTVAGIDNQWVPDHKKTSAHLLSQIHLCRFFYKLIERMQSLQRGSQRLKKLMGTLILGKFDQLKELTHINPRYANIFKRTKQFQKILGIVEQYNIKYQKLINNQQTNQSYNQALKSIDFQLTGQILSLYDDIIKFNALEGHEEQIIMLDYLITMKQLLAINSNNDIQYFHKKSKIQAIVEGRPAKNITAQHLQAIIHKLRLFKVI